MQSYGLIDNYSMAPKGSSERFTRKCHHSTGNLINSPLYMFAHFTALFLENVRDNKAVFSDLLTAQRIVGGQTHAGETGRDKKVFLV